MQKIIFPHIFALLFFAEVFSLFSCKSPPPPPPEIPFCTLTLSLKEDGEPYSGAVRNFSLVPVDEKAVLSSVPSDILEANLALLAQESLLQADLGEDGGTEKKSKKEKKDEEEIFLVDLPPYALSAQGASGQEKVQSEEDDEDFSNAGFVYTARVLPGDYWLYENEENLHIFISARQEESSAVISYCSSIQHLAESVEAESTAQSLALFLEDKNFSSLGYNNLLQRTLAASRQKISLDMSLCTKVTTLGYKAFYNCASLVSLTLPGTVSAIEKDTFSFCTELLYLFIPRNILHIEGGSFSSCTKLSLLTVAKENKAFVAEDGALYSFDKKMLVAYPSASGALSILPGVESLSDYAFSFCTNLLELSLADIVHVGQCAFSDCSFLVRLNISASVADIEKNAFVSCPSLKDISVASENKNFKAQKGILYSADGRTLIAWPSASGNISIDSNEVFRIEDSAFENNQSIKTVVLPENVREVGFRAFASCPLLSSADLRGVEKLEPFAFASCPSLSSVTFSGSLAFAEGSTFSGCTALTHITVPKENAFFFADQNGALYSKEKDRLFSYPAASGEVWLEESVLFIESYAFHKNTKLSVLHAPNVQSIGNFSFAQCSSFSKADFGNDLKEIGTYAFFACTALREFFIPKSPASVVKNAAFWLWTEEQTILCQDLVCPALWSAEWDLDCEATILWNQPRPKEELLEAEN